jgi:vacuolar-type H+-ATPase subunit F/Vma7
LKIAFVLDRSTATAFKLAGIGEVYSADTAEEAEENVDRLKEDPDMLAIVMSDFLFNQIPATIERIWKEKYPLILSIPSTKGKVAAGPDPLAELIRRKVGIEVRF